MKLYQPSVLRSLMESYDLKALKGLGQNFLTDKNIIDNIISKSLIDESDLVIEIGPGLGTLTQELLHKAGHVIAVEIDKKLIPVLRDVFKDTDNLTLVNRDIMKLDIGELIREEGRGLKSVKVVANLPYYITSPLVMKLLEEYKGFSLLTLMMQKEVAERITAPPSSKARGAISVAVEYYAEALIIMDVSKEVFYPKPKVDSCVVMLKPREYPSKVGDEELLFKLIKAAFQMRRKTLLNALSNIEGLEKGRIVEALLKVDVNPERRGETLSLEEFIKIANSL